MGYQLADEVAINAPKKTPPRDLLGLIAIARRINDHTRTGWLTREEIAHWARIDVRSVKALRERLVEAGLLVVLKVGGGRRRATEFYIPPMPGYLPGEPPRPIDLKLEPGTSAFPLPEPNRSVDHTKGGSLDFPLSEVARDLDDHKRGSLDFSLSEMEKGKTVTQRGKLGGKRGKSGLPPNPHSTPHHQSSSSSYRAEEEAHRATADNHPEEADKINEEEGTPSASRAARVIAKQIGCPLHEAEQIAQLIARENHIRKPLHIYVAGIPAPDLRAWQETTREQVQTRTTTPARAAGRCPNHYQDMPCIGCAADAKAMPV